MAFPAVACLLIGGASYVAEVCPWLDLFHLLNSGSPFARAVRM